MISGLIISAPPPAQGNVPTAAAGAHGKGFSSILKSSVQKTQDVPQTDSPAQGAQETSSNNTTPVRNKPVSKNEPVNDVANTKPPIGKDTQQESNSADMSNNMLMQLVLQMRASGQQATENPAGKEVPSEAQGVMIAQVAQSLQNKNGNDAAQEPALMQSEDAPIVNTEETPQLNNKGDNADSFLSKLSENTANSPAKTAENLKSIVMDAQSKDGNVNPSITGDPVAKAEGAPNNAIDLASKNAAFALKSAGTSSAVSDNLSQLKADVSVTAASIHGTEDKGSSTDIKNLTSIYAQMSQTQPSASHAPSTQETVPVNRISSVDEIISKAVDSGQKNLIIKIDPPDLGSVQIKLSYDNGVLKADVRVDSSAVKDSFNLALPQIKTSLENSGIKISEFNVDVREDQYRDEQQRNNQGQQQQRQNREANNGFFDFFA